MGKHRAETKHGRRGAIRLAQLHEGTGPEFQEPERHQQILRLPMGLYVVKNREPR